MTQTLPSNITDMRLSDLLKMQGVTVIINVTTEATPPPVIMPPPTERMLRIGEVKDIAKLSETTIYERVKNGEFPAPVKSGKRCNRWRMSDVQRYIEGS